MGFHIANDEAADRVLDEHPFALLAGMMLDQQFPMERAFAGPATVLERFGTLEPRAIAEADPDEFKELCSRTPAIHRFPGSMAARLQQLAEVVNDEYDGHAERIWTQAVDGDDLLKRLTALPGFGKQKAQIFVALVAKQTTTRPQGWQQAAGAYAEDGYRSVADVTDEESLQKVRDYKQAQKAAKKAQTRA